MAEQHKDDADLLWYFGAGQRAFRHLSLGSLLERADILGHDSTGEPIPLAPEDDWAMMHLSPTPSEPSYTLDEDALLRAAFVSRRLRRVKAEDAAVLLAYYGDIGARWSKTRVGRLLALYALTEAGQSWLAREKPIELRADEQIGGYAKGPPTPARRAALLRMHTQARALLSRASDSWEVACGR